MGMGNFGGGCGASVGTLLHSCAKVREAIELPFGVVSGVGPGIRLLDEVLYRKCLLWHSVPYQRCHCGESANCGTFLASLLWRLNFWLAHDTVERHLEFRVID